MIDTKVVWDTLQRLFSSLLVAGITAAASLIFSYFSVSGGVDYAVSETETANIVTIISSNTRTEAADIEISISNDLIEMISSSGTAGVSLEKNLGRKGGVVNIAKLLPNSVITIVVKTTKSALPPIVSLIQAPNGFSIAKANVSRSHIDFTEILIQSISMFMVLFIGQTIIERRSERAEQNRITEIKDIREDLSEMMATRDKYKLTVQRLRIYYGQMLRHLRRESDFWQDCFKQLVMTSGGSKQNAFKLLNIISRKLGYKSIVSGTTLWQDPKTDDDVDIEVIMDFLIDESKRARFDEVVLGKKPTQDTKSES
jgi:hypothetical protein